MTVAQPGSRPDPGRLIMIPVAALGLALIVRSAAAAAVWLVFCALQAYRAAREEQVLLRALPAYRGYRSLTAALLPGIF